MFVEPSLTETPIKRRKEWIIPPQLYDPKLDDDEWWRSVLIEPKLPISELPDPIDPVIRSGIRTKKDWVTDDATVLQFDGRLVGQGGGLDFEVLPARTDAGDPGTLVNVNPGSALAPGAVVVTQVEHELGSFTLPGNGLNVVGGGGLSSALLQNINVRRSNLIRGLPGGLADGFFDR